MLSVTELSHLILKQIDNRLILQDCPSQQVSLWQALGRITATDIHSSINVPAFDVSAMDGYAIFLDDTPKISETSNIPYQIIGESIAGKGFDGIVQPKECVRIMTGASLPKGANCVVMQENTIRLNNSTITFTENFSPKQGDNIRQKGEEITTSQIVIAKGTMLTARHIMLLASIGIAEIEVYQRLTVAVMSTGDELVQVGNSLNADQIYDSNRPALLALLSKLPVNIVDLGCIPDDFNALETAFTKASQTADVIISSGAVSVGDYDFIKPIIEKLGSITSHKVAMKPGKPFMLGELGNALFFGLAGNPLSSFIGFLLLVKPALLRLSGQVNQETILTLSATLTTPLKKSIGRADYQRGIASQTLEGDWQVASIGKQDSHRVKGLADANCLMLLPAEAGHYTTGQMVDIILFSSLEA